MKAIITCLFIGLAASSLSAEQPTWSLSEAMAERFHESLLRSLPPLLSPRPIILSKSVAFCGGATSLKTPIFYGCGCMHSMAVDFDSRRRLPTDPTSLLSDSYMKCRLIKAALLETRVPILAYPAGYFGDLEYDGLLVSDWFEFSDEAMLKNLFGLLVEVIDGPDYGELDFYLDGTLDLKLSDYRKNTGFNPELVFEFIGDTPLRIEVSLTAKRLVIQAGEKWDFYCLDQWSAAALKDILTTEQSRKLKQI